MTEKQPTCQKCGAKLVPAKETITFDGSLPMDGSWAFGNIVCPHCHPELVEDNNNN